VAAQPQPVALAVARADLEALTVRADDGRALLVARVVLLLHLELPPQQRELVLDRAQAVLQDLLLRFLGMCRRDRRGERAEQQGPPDSPTNDSVHVKPPGRPLSKARAVHESPPDGAKRERPADMLE